MQVSCLTVTQPGRIDLLRHAVGDFARQTHAERELVIVHDGDPSFDAEVRQLCTLHGSATIRVRRVTPGSALGALRNHAVEQAHGECICQWDDDDRYHPMRIEMQLQALEKESADFCFLVDQLHWFPARGELYWDDWDSEQYPLNFIQGTLLGYRDRMPRYPESARGEDTALCLEILRAGRKITRLRGVGWCYVYAYHGGNAWHQGHHLAIVQAKSLGAAQLLGKEYLLRQRLAEYEPALGSVILPYPGGGIRI